MEKFHSAGKKLSKKPQDRTPKLLRVSVKCLPHHAGLDLPDYMSEGSSGMDLRAAIAETLILKPGDRIRVPTGIAMAVPAGFEAQVRPRSGLAYRNGIGLLNAPGTIDSDYRGEIQVILINLGHEPFRIERGARIAQLIISSCQRVSFKIAADLDVTKRNDGGFGHTGL